MGLFGRKKQTLEPSPAPASTATSGFNRKASVPVSADEVAKINALLKQSNDQGDDVLKKRRASLNNQSRPARVDLMQVNEAVEAVQNEVENPVDIVEVFSLPQATEVGKIIGLKPGLAMGLTTGWGFDLKEHRDAAKKHVQTVKPWLVIGSPECRMFTALRNLNRAKYGEAKFAEKSEAMIKAKEHLRFVMEL